MAQSPYDVLGVSPDATQDEITKAYRKLAKKYHPDLHPDDPLAAEKMRELNAAYDALKNGTFTPDDNSGWEAYDREHGYSSRAQTTGNGSGDGDSDFRDASGWEAYDRSHGYGRSYTADSGSVMETVRFYLHSGQYREAVNLLGTVGRRGAEWYYLSAVANINLGNSVTALRHAREAVKLEPDNPDYRRVMEQIESIGGEYRARRTSHGFSLVAAAFCCTALCAGGSCAVCGVGLRRLCIFCP